MRWSLRVLLFLLVALVAQGEGTTNPEELNQKEKRNRFKQLKAIKKANKTALSCVKSFTDTRTSLAGSDFKSVMPGAPRSFDGIVDSVERVPLTVENILKAYQNGLFPWNPETKGNIKWYNPKYHGYAELEPIVTGKYSNLNDAWKKVYKNGWTITFNREFSEVIKRCAGHKRSNYSHVWLTEEVQKAYIELHKQGYAHSVEVWDQYGNLIGGTYSLGHRGSYSAESMFHEVSDAGKVAVRALAERLYYTGHKIVDTQVVNANSRDNFKAVAVPRNEYLRLLDLEEQNTLFVPGEVIFPDGVYTQRTSGGPLVLLSI